MAMEISVTGMHSTVEIGTGTNVRDISAMLDLWAHKETPLLNRIQWGPDSGGLVIEWVSEHLGWRYVEVSGALASNGTTFEPASLSATITQAEQVKMIKPGTMLYAKGVANSGELSGDHGWFVVTCVTTPTVTGAWIGSTKCSVAASGKMWIVGAFANEGSAMNIDTSRTRAMMSNKMTILRQDITVTGSMAATDMYAVGDEIAHQKAMRLLEMQKDRELSILLGWAQARTSAAVGYMKGVAQYMVGDVSNSNMDNSTTSLTKSAVNTIVAAMADLGHRPNVAVGSYTQVRKFTSWDEARIRSRPDDRVGGEWVNSFLCDTGIELDLIPIMQFPTNWLMIFDTENVTLRAKRGRKLLIQKLGLAGDYEQWQILSEYSCEFKNSNKQGYGGFHILT